MTFGEIDDDSVAEAAKLLGTELRSHVPWVRYVNEDSIAHFTEAIGDYNPLFNDPGYAANSSIGELVAPPTFLFAVVIPGNNAGLPGVSLLYAGTDFIFYDWVRSGDRMDASTTFTEMTEKSGRFADRWILQKVHTTYVRGDDRELVAVADSYTARVPRPGTVARGQKNKYPVREPHSYSPQEISAIEDAILSEPVRGSQERFWEEVDVGEDLPKTTRGPLTSTDIMAVYAGLLGARPYGGTAARAILHRRQSGEYVVNEKTGGLDAIGRGHLESGSAGDLGIGGAYDIGPGRTSWAATIITNWMGDDAFMQRLKVRCLASNLISDTTYVTGKVVAKTIEGETPAVDIDIELRNQLGHLTADGTAHVLLPSRAHGPIRLPLSR